MMNRYLTILLAGLFLILSFQSHSLDLIVNYGEYFFDHTPGDGLCDYDIHTLGEQCTLNAAVREIEQQVVLGNQGPHSIQVPHSVPPSNDGTHLVYPNMLLFGTVHIFSNDPEPPIITPVEALSLPGTPAAFDTNNANQVTFTNLRFNLRSGAVPAIEDSLAPANVLIDTVRFDVGNDLNEIGLRIGRGGHVTCMNCLFTGGSTRAIEVDNGTLNLIDSEISDNHVDGNGGAIQMNNLDEGNVTLLRTHVVNNSATVSGGGIYSDSGSLNLTNAVIEGNQADQHGGGLALVTAGATLINNSTITGNVSAADNNGGQGGGIYTQGFAFVQMRNSILSGNDRLDWPSEGECVTSSNLETFGPNVIGDDPDCNPTVVTGPPAVREDAPLQGIGVDVSGQSSQISLAFPNRWHPAIELGDNSACENDDIIGNPRPLDSDGDTVADCDVGAFELDCSANGPFGDIDGDGLSYFCDNCPNNHNPNQTDTDGDNIGDACEDLFDLNVQIGGSGLGQVESTATGIDCPGDCSESYVDGTQVTLTATADPGYEFREWLGDCTGTVNTCNLTMDQVRGTIAVFGPERSTLTVTRQGSQAANGVMTSNPAGIDCPSGSCNALFDNNSVVVLTATSNDPGAAFSSWSGCPLPSQNICLVTVTQNTTVNAHFEAPVLLSVVVDGNAAGTGSVISQPGGIDCTSQIASDCEEGFGLNQTVTLTASVFDEVTKYFAGWSGGGCSGTGTCVVTMDQAKTVTATFSNKHRLVVNNNESALGDAASVITSDTGSISCSTGGSAGCSHYYLPNTTVVLTMTPDDGNSWVDFWEFCDDPIVTDLTCTVMVDQLTTSVRANMTEIYPLTVETQGTGSGRAFNFVSAWGPNQGELLNCADNCTLFYKIHSPAIDVFVEADAGSQFVQFNGDCSGTNSTTCSFGFPFNQPREVFVTFDATHFPLTVNVTGNGSVQSAPAGIDDCRSDSGTCEDLYAVGATVSLTPTADSGWVFDGWSGGGCSGSGVCVVTLDQAQSVGALFIDADTLFFDGFE